MWYSAWIFLSDRQFSNWAQANVLDCSVLSDCVNFCQTASTVIPLSPLLSNCVQVSLIVSTFGRHSPKCQLTQTNTNAMISQMANADLHLCSWDWIDTNQQNHQKGRIRFPERGNTCRSFWMPRWDWSADIMFSWASHCLNQQNFTAAFCYLCIIFVFFFLIGLGYLSVLPLVLVHLQWKQRTLDICVSTETEKQMQRFPVEGELNHDMD